MNAMSQLHFHSTSHPFIRSAEPGDTWVWCYVDKLEAGELEV
jgi:hypothetical protein